MTIPTDLDIDLMSKRYDNSLSSMAESIWMPEGFKEGAKWMRNETKIDLLKSLLIDSFGIAINCNDFFNYACADMIMLDYGDLEWVLPIYEKHGQPGLNACMSHIAKTLPIEPWRTPEFNQALEEIKKINPEIRSEY